MKISQLIAASMPQLHTETYLISHQYNVHTIKIKLLILKNLGQKPHFCFTGILIFRKLGASNMRTYSKQNTTAPAWCDL